MDDSSPVTQHICINLTYAWRQFKVDRGAAVFQFSATLPFPSPRPNVLHTLLLYTGFFFCFYSGSGRAGQGATVISATEVF